MRKYILVLVAGVCAASVFAADKRPNVIFICTDQQHAGMLSCDGLHPNNADAEIMARTAYQALMGKTFEGPIPAAPEETGNPCQSPENVIRKQQHSIERQHAHRCRESHPNRCEQQ